MMPSVDLGPFFEMPATVMPMPTFTFTDMPTFTASAQEPEPSSVLGSIPNWQDFLNQDHAQGSGSAAFENEPPTGSSDGTFDWSTILTAPFSEGPRPTESATFDFEKMFQSHTQHKAKSNTKSDHDHGFKFNQDSTEQGDMSWNEWLAMMGPMPADNGSVDDSEEDGDEDDTMKSDDSASSGPSEPATPGSAVDVSFSGDMSKKAARALGKSAKASKKRSRQNKEERKEKNRLSAKRSRERSKAKMSHLEEQNNRLLDTLQRKNQEMAILKERLARMESAVKHLLAGQSVNAVPTNHVGLAPLLTSFQQLRLPSPVLPLNKLPDLVSESGSESPHTDDEAVLGLSPLPGSTPWLAM